MADDKSDNKTSIKGAFGTEKATGKPVLFEPDDMDIYVNKVTHDAYIFHAKPIDHDSIELLEYDPKEKRVDVVLKNGNRMDLGVKIQWLIRPYFSKAKEVSIVQTKDREPVDGTIVPLVHKADEKKYEHIDKKE